MKVSRERWERRFHFKIIWFFKFSLKILYKKDRGGDSQRWKKGKRLVSFSAVKTILRIVRGFKAFSLNWWSLHYEVMRWQKDLVSPFLFPEGFKYFAGLGLHQHCAELRSEVVRVLPMEKIISYPSCKWGWSASDCVVYDMQILDLPPKLIDYLHHISGTSFSCILNLLYKVSSFKLLVCQLKWQKTKRKTSASSWMK